MKGSSFNKSLECIIDVNGEYWSQGDTLCGTIALKNHSKENIDLSKAGVALGFFDIKKIHDKNIDYHQLISPLRFFKNIAPQESIEKSFEIKLDPNCPITDKKLSGYIFYGDLEMTTNQLQLKILPQKDFLKILELFDRFFRFKVKETKNGKKGLEFKLNPPTSREMANIDSLLLNMTKSPDSLQLSFNFILKKLNVSGVSHKIEKNEFTILRNILNKEYLFAPGLIDQDKILKMFEDVLAEIKLNNIF
jgi:uncharacterized protein YktA (UPF0223 family)